MDLFTSGKRIPKCEMILEWENESVPPKRMRHKVGLQGARDHKFFLLVVDPGTFTYMESVATKIFYNHQFVCILL